MATTSEYIAFVLQQADLPDRLTAKKMFGEYALYIDDKIIALACDNSLFLKPSKASQQLKLTYPMHPPYPGAKPHWLIDETLDDGERLQSLLLATAAELPPAKPRRKKSTAKP